MTHILVLLFLTTAAQAQEHKHPTETITGATAEFYRTWERPDQAGVSCCNLSDCAVAVEVKHVRGKWWARKKDGDLISIPREKIEQNRDSPDGQSHLCAVGTTVFCFIAGQGG